MRMANFLENGLMTVCSIVVTVTSLRRFYSTPHRGFSPKLKCLLHSRIAIPYSNRSSASQAVSISKEPTLSADLPFPSGLYGNRSRTFTSKSEHPHCQSLMQQSALEYDDACLISH